MRIRAWRWSRRIEELRKAYTNAELFLGARTTPGPKELRVTIPGLEANGVQIEALLLQLNAAMTAQNHIG